MRVVIDADTANMIDDQFAIAYALGSPALDVRGVVSVQDTISGGTASLARYQQEAEWVVALCGAAGRVPCLSGAATPMEDRRTLVPSAGLDFLIAEARRGPLALIAIGPLTNVASLLLAAPEVAGNLRVVWLGGFADFASYRRWRFGELNGRADIAAWRVVLESDVSLLQLPPWPGVEKLAVPYRAYAEELRAMRRPIADYLARLLVWWMEERVSVMHTHTHGRTHEILWDVANVAALIDPARVTVVAQPAPMLDAAGAHDWAKPGRMIDVLTDLDANWVLGDMSEALLRLPESVDTALLESLPTDPAWHIAAWGGQP